MQDIAYRGPQSFSVSPSRTKGSVGLDDCQLFADNGPVMIFNAQTMADDRGVDVLVSKNRPELNLMLWLFCDLSRVDVEVAYFCTQGGERHVVQCTQNSNFAGSTAP